MADGYYIRLRERCIDLGVRYKDKGYSGMLSAIQAAQAEEHQRLYPHSKPGDHRGIPAKEG